MTVHPYNKTDLIFIFMDYQIWIQNASKSKKLHISTQKQLIQLNNNTARYCQWLNYAQQLLYLLTTTTIIIHIYRNLYIFNHVSRLPGHPLFFRHGLRIGDIPLSSMFRNYSQPSYSCNITTITSRTTTDDNNKYMPLKLKKMYVENERPKYW